MTTMILTPIGWSRGGALRAGAIALALVLSGCGGGSSSSTPSSTPSVASQIQTLVATGSATDYEQAVKLLVDNQDSLSAADFEAAMAAVSQT